MKEDADYHFSVKVYVEDLEVLYALRGLAMFSQKTDNVYKPWKHAGKTEWRSQRRIVKMYFTLAGYRSDFIEIAQRLLGGHFEIHEQLDNDPLPS